VVLSAKPATSNPSAHNTTTTGCPGWRRRGRAGAGYSHSLMCHSLGEHALQV